MAFPLVRTAILSGRLVLCSNGGAEQRLVVEAAQEAVAALLRQYLKELLHECSKGKGHVPRATAAVRLQFPLDVLLKGTAHIVVAARGPVVLLHDSWRATARFLILVVWARSGSTRQPPLS